MKNLRLISLILIIILIQFIQIELSYASGDDPTVAPPTQVVETIQVSEPTPPAPASTEPEPSEKEKHEEVDDEAKEHMIILVCGILGGCLGTAILIGVAWFMFKKFKAKENNNNEEVNKEVLPFENFIMEIPGDNELKQSQTLPRKRSIDTLNRNNYTQAISPPNSMKNVNVDSRIVQHIKQELLEDLSKQGDYANIPEGVPISKENEELDIVQQIKQAVLRDLSASNRNDTRDSILNSRENRNDTRDSIVNSRVNTSMDFDQDLVNRLKQEALQDVKNELKERLRKEMSLADSNNASSSSRHNTYDLT